LKSNILQRNIIHPKIRYYCELLNVNISTSATEIKKKYYKLAQRYHPDKNIGNPLAEKIFADIAEAYNTLIDPIKIEKLNEDYIMSLPQKIKIGNYIVNVGGFFGARYFSKDTTAMYSRKRKIAAALEYSAKDKYIASNFFDDDYFEDENSILDSPEWDMFEIMFSGAMNEKILNILQQEFLNKGLDCFYDLPWVAINTQGFLYFVNFNFKSAAELYAKINKIIQNNIVFMYREAISLEALYFKELSENKNPIKDYLLKSKYLFEKAIEIGACRLVSERQECFTIRKALAEIYEVLNLKKDAIKIWKYVLQHKKRYSIEAAEKIKELSSFNLFGRKKDIIKEKIQIIDTLLKSEKPTKEFEFKF